MVGAAVGGLNLAAFFSTQDGVAKIYAAHIRQTYVQLSFTFHHPQSPNKITIFENADFSSHSRLLRHLDAEIASDPTAVSPRTHGARRSKASFSEPSSRVYSL